MEVLRGQKLWLHLQEVLQIRIQEETDRLKLLVTPEELPQHNLRVGRIQALQELLDYPDFVLKLSKQSDNVRRR